MFKEYKTISVFIPSAASCAPLFCLCMCMLSPSAKLNIILVLVMFINFLIILYRRGVWRNIWRGSMLRSIGCLTSLVEHLYVCLKFFNHLLVTASAVLSHILFLFLLSRHPSLHLVPTKQGSACLWSLSSGTGWSMLWPIVKLFQSWCSVKLWLMARSGLTRHIHLDSWVRCMPDHNFGCMMTMLWPSLAPDSIINYIFPADVVSTKSARCMDWIGQEYCSCRLW